MLLGGNHPRMLDCGMMRHWGGKHSVFGFGFEESGVRGHGNSIAHFSFFFSFLTFAPCIVYKTKIRNFRRLIRCTL